MNIVVYSASSVDEEVFEKYKPVNTTVRFERSPVSVSHIEELDGVSAICVERGDKVNEDVIDALVTRGIKGIIARCSEVSNIDVKYAEKKHIKVFRCPYGSPHAVAELAVSMIMTLNRKVHIADSRNASGNFTIEGLFGFDLIGKTAGILGNNKVANHVGHILHGFGCDILIYSKEKLDNHHTQYNSKFQYTNDMEKVLRAGDVISIHLPLTSEFRHIFDKKSFRMMKNHVVIVDVSRGHSMKTNSLYNALLAGEIGAVGMEVSADDNERWTRDELTGDKRDHVYGSFKLMKNVLLTPNIANLTDEALERRTKTSYANLLSLKGGHQGKYQVTCL